MSATAARSRTVFGVPVPVALFFLAIMLPTAVSLNLGGLRLSAYRVVLLIVFLPMLLQLLSGARGRIHLFDALLETGDGLLKFEVRNHTWVPLGLCASLGKGVARIYKLHKTRGIHMCVDLRRRNVRMAKQCLEHA